MDEAKFHEACGGGGGGVGGGLLGGNTRDRVLGGRVRGVGWGGLWVGGQRMEHG